MVIVMTKSGNWRRDYDLSETLTRMLEKQEVGVDDQFLVFEFDDPEPADEVNYHITDHGSLVHPSDHPPKDKYRITLDEKMNREVRKIQTLNSQIVELTWDAAEGIEKLPREKF